MSHSAFIIRILIMLGNAYFAGLWIEKGYYSSAAVCAACFLIVWKGWEE